MLTIESVLLVLEIPRTKVGGGEVRVKQVSPPLADSNRVGYQAMIKK